MKTAKKVLLIVALFVLLIVGASSIVITRENEYSLIRQFGKIDHVVSEAGISFKIPFIETVDKLPKQIMLYDLSSSDVITSDKKTMICDSYILWHIVDPQIIREELLFEKFCVKADVYRTSDNSSQIIIYYLFKKSGISSLAFFISILSPNQVSFHSFNFLSTESCDISA